MRSFLRVYNFTPERVKHSLELFIPILPNDSTSINILSWTAVFWIWRVDSFPMEFVYEFFWNDIIRKNTRLHAKWFKLLHIGFVFWRSVNVTRLHLPANRKIVFAIWYFLPLIHQPIVKCFRLIDIHTFPLRIRHLRRHDLRLALHRVPRCSAAIFFVSEIWHNA